ncbi:MAG: hypothetical protein KA974_10275 [Saprospiraceae bacterium]|nr:hypothetical protein [Saprospiraceae bacterium]
MDREKDVWSTLTGERNSSADGDNCAIKNPDDSITDGTMKNGVCTTKPKLRGLTFAENVLGTINTIFGSDLINQNQPTTIPTSTDVQPSKGMGALGWSVIILAVAGIGFGVYKLTKK